MTDPNGALPHSLLDNVAGTFGTGKITPASARFRPYLHGWEMTSATTHFKGPPGVRRREGQLVHRSRFRSAGNTEDHRE
eukprot:5271973-Pyramimonas_sp.AAC.1